MPDPARTRNSITTPPARPVRREKNPHRAPPARAIDTRRWRSAAAAMGTWSRSASSDTRAIRVRIPWVPRPNSSRISGSRMPKAVRSSSSTALRPNSTTRASSGTAVGEPGQPPHRVAHVAEDGPHQGRLPVPAGTDGSAAPSGAGPPRASGAGPGGPSPAASVPSALSAASMSAGAWIGGAGPTGRRRGRRPPGWARPGRGAGPPPAARRRGGGTAARRGRSAAPAAPPARRSPRPRTASRWAAATGCPGGRRPPGSPRGSSRCRR